MFRLHLSCDSIFQSERHQKKTDSAADRGHSHADVSDRRRVNFTAPYVQGAKGGTEEELSSNGGDQNDTTQQLVADVELWLVIAGNHDSQSEQSSDRHWYTEDKTTSKVLDGNYEI